jgi:pyruvate/2-oxoglutarate dehydrogenase complex dihydrolipoamide acyltransferase (E2) component
VTTPVPPDEDAPPASPDPPKKHRSPWIWVCAGLGVIAVGALVWAFATRSDLNDTQSQLDSTEQELASAQQKLDAATPVPTATTSPTATPTATATPEDDKGNALLTAGALAAAKSVYDDLRQQLGATQEDLAQTQQDLDKANQQAEQADKDAAAAKDKASQASNETEKAQAEAEQARAETEAARSKASIAVECAKGYISAFGTLFDGDDLKAQAEKVRTQIKQISADCKTAFEGS